MFDDADSVIREELRPGERLLWSGQPPQGMRLHAADVFMIPFSLMWGGFAIFWEIGVIASDAPMFFAGFGLPFVLIGLYLIIGRFWVDARQRARTYYGLTDSRVIIVSGAFSRSARSWNIPTLSDVALTKKKGGNGTITFGPVNFWKLPWPIAMLDWYANAGWPEMGGYSSPRIELDSNVEEVYDKLMAVQSSRGDIR